MPPRNSPPPVGEERTPLKAVTVYTGLQEDIRRPDRYGQFISMFNGNQPMAERFLSVTLSALASNSDILERCTPLSIMEAIRESASLGLEPAGYGGEAAIVRYGDQAKLSVMYRGFLKRIRNSREVSAVDCQLVYLNDPVFELEFGTSPRIRHVPLLFGEKDGQGDLVADRGAIRGAYAWAKLTNGELIIEWMPDVEIAQARANSPAVKFNRPSPWDNWYGEMARKTVIRRLAKRLPQEAIQRIVAVDDETFNAQVSELAAEDPRSRTAQIAMRSVGLEVAPVEAIEAGKERVDQKFIEGDGSAPPPQGIISPLRAPKPVREVDRLADDEEPPLPEAPSASPPSAPQVLQAPPPTEERTPAPTPQRMIACDAPAGEQRDNERCLLPNGHAGVHRGANWSWPR